VDDIGADSTIEITEESEEDENEESTWEETVKIKLFGSLPTGIPFDAVANVIGDEEIPASWRADGQEYIALKVNDISMYPRYLEGDILIVRITPNCPNGSDVIVYADGADAVLRQIQQNEDGSLTLKPYNPEYPSQDLPCGSSWRHHSWCCCPNEKNFVFKKNDYSFVCL